MAQFDAFPIKGKDVVLSPYFKARVTEIMEKEVLLTINAPDRERFEEDFGTTEVRVQDNEVLLIFTPKIGAPLRAQNVEGVIIAADAESFTVDFNPPLVGKAIILDIEVVSLTPSSTLAPLQISWNEDHDKGLEMGKKEGKPALLILYADWCSWSQKLFDESLQDPRIRNLKDRLVWIKLNSDKQKEFARQYQQKGFPMIILFQADGTIGHKIEGYADGATLREAIGLLIDKPAPKES